MDLHFSIGPNTYDVPEYIKVGVFERAISWDISELKNLKPFTATIVGCPLSALDILDDDISQFITSVCLQRMQINTTDVTEEVNGHSLINFDEMTFANFVDIDTYISKGIGTNLSNILSILYSASIDIVKEWDTRLVWPAVQLVARWRMSVYTEYDEFFDLADQKEASDEAKESNIQLMWWEATMALANEDFIKMHQVVERPYRECLNYLTWKKSKIQKEKLEQLRRKHDIQRSTR